MAAFALPDRLTLDEATATLRSLQVNGGETGPVVIDASALQVFDSSALAVLLESARRAHAAGRPFEVRGVPSKLADLAGLYGLEEVLPGLAGPAPSIATRSPA